MKLVKRLGLCVAAVALVSTPAFSGGVPVKDAKHIQQKSKAKGNLQGTSSRRKTTSKSTAGVGCSWRRSPAQAIKDRADVAAKVASTCKAQGVDPALALSIAYQESQFNQNCTAPTTPHSGGERAEGVMQVLPATGRRLFKKAGLGAYNGQNEDQNILAGCMYLKEGLKITNGSAYHTAGGYHAGYGSKVWSQNKAIPTSWPKTLNYANTVNNKWMPFFSKQTGGLGGGAVAVDQFKADVAISGQNGIEAMTAESATYAQRLSEESQNIGKFDSEMTEWQTNSKIKLFNAQGANQLIQALTLLAQFKQLDAVVDSFGDSSGSELVTQTNKPVAQDDDVRVVYDQVEGRWKLIRADGSWSYIDMDMPETVALVPTAPVIVASGNAGSTSTGQPTAAASVASAAPQPISAASRVSALLAD